MKKSDLNGGDLTESDSLDFRYLYSALSSEMEAACTYEYMRESQILRDTLNAPAENERRKKALELQSPFLLSLTPEQCVRLMLALQMAGFPKSWKRLSDTSRTKLVSLLAGSKNRTKRGDKQLYPPVIIEQGWPEFDHSENCWRVGQLEPFELSLFRKWEHSGRKCFFGFIRIDCAYNETEARDAFKNEFKKHWPKTRGGGAPKWRERLKQLAVMRIWKWKRDQWKRLNLVAKFCNYKGCVREATAWEERCSLGYGDREPMSEAAKVEMSRARSDARTFFQSLFFPDEEPLSW
jgi:hypothetical protein